MMAGLRRAREAGRPPARRKHSSYTRGFPRPRPPVLVAVTPSASYSVTVRLSITNRPGMLGRVAMAMGDAGGDIGAVDLVESGRDRIVRDITISSRDSGHSQQIVNRLRHLGGVRVVNASDRTFLMHLGGKIEIHNKVPIR